MKKALVLLFAAAMFSATAPAAIIIDDFNDGDDIVSSNSNNVTVSSTTSGITGVLDGWRTLEATCTAGTLNCSISRTVSVSVDQGEGAASIDTSVAGVGRFIYLGANGNGLNGGLGYLFDAGNFLVDVTFFNPGQGLQPGTQAIVGLDDGNGWVEVSQDILGVGTLAYNVAGFGFAPGTPILGIRLSIVSANESPDVGIDNFRFEVPEPGTYAMLGAGLVGLALLRRRTAK